MRDANDLKRIRFTLICGVTLDMERVAEDPSWSMAARNCDLSVPREFNFAMMQYLQYHLNNSRMDRLLAEMPATCGPADIYGMTVEAPDGNSSSNGTPGVGGGENPSEPAAFLDYLNREGFPAEAVTVHEQAPVVAGPAEGTDPGRPGVGERHRPGS